MTSLRTFVRSSAFKYSNVKVEEISCTNGSNKSALLNKTLVCSQFCQKSSQQLAEIISSLSEDQTQNQVKIENFCLIPR